jgi:hypothetical protein
MIETLGYRANHDDREKNDFYATPPEEVVNLLSREKLYGTILDNSCGRGHIIKEVAKAYPDNKIIATDLIDRGYGIGGLDFLDDDYPYIDNIDTIIMNPPFKLIVPFVTKSLEIANKKVILFARMQFLESQTRYNKIFKFNKPNRIYIYVDRVACAKGGNFEKALSSNMAFAWFIWDKEDTNVSIDWIRRRDKVEL